MTNRLSQFLNEERAHPSASAPAGFEMVLIQDQTDSRRLRRARSIHELAWLLAQLRQVGGPDDVVRWLGEA